MKWQGRRQSSNVEDARGKKMSGGGLPLAGIIQAVFRLLGPKGLIALVAVGIIGWQMGLIDPASLLGGGGQVTDVEYQSSADEERLSAVCCRCSGRYGGCLDCRVSTHWQTVSRSRSSSFTETRYPTGCGTGDARMGPFYCPADQKIYIDLSFYDSLEQEFSAPGDFAQAYVIAHEVGHHVQTLLGISEKVAARRGQPDYNEYSVRLELQADFLAGLWAHHNRHYLEKGDIEEAMRAANQIGDDAIQSRTQGKITPHAFTHGTSEQRMRWFTRGQESGRLEDSDTFEMPYGNL